MENRFIIPGLWHYANIKALTLLNTTLNKIEDWVNRMHNSIMLRFWPSQMTQKLETITTIRSCCRRATKKKMIQCFKSQSKVATNGRQKCELSSVFAKQADFQSSSKGCHPTNCYSRNSRFFKKSEMQNFEPSMQA
ncbi:conserved hypothetical protein [Ricinus communis]|uniref:Uncharacterized protein n=1 Tax=Ricinus communis TaxID=3988 RepID=B9SJM3_RICCO|nr:conserved hypothetical protein [Ricinus communis]